VFVFDVSQASHDSGMLRVATETLKSMLDRLPGGNRTNVAFVTVNSSVHFYSFKAGARAPQMFVATDLDDIFLPAPVDLLVNLHDCRALIEDFLDLLPIMHSKRRDVESALGPALEAAANVMASLGGKMLVFLSGLPSLGEGRLANRDNPRLFGSAKENTLQQPASDVYKKKAIKFTRFQITVDLFLFGDVFMDVATLAALPQTTGGQLNYYPSFHHASDGERFQRDLSRNLLRTTAWEAVMRVRVSAGFQVSAFYGNMFLRSPDLMSLPVTDSDKAYVVELRSPANKDVAQPFVTIQAALLYTSSEGERRIRVHTTVVPVVSSLLDLYKASQSSAIINLVAKQAVEQVAPEGFHRARELIRSTTMGIVRSWRAVQQQSFQAGAALPEALTTLALLALGTLKTPAFRDASDVRSDERADMLNVIRTLGLSALETLVRPRMMAVHELKAQEGLVEEKSQAVVFPPELPLSASQLPSDGCVLIDNGLRIFLRFGRAVSPAFVSTLFGVKSLEDVDMRSLRLLEPSAGDNSSALARLRALISNLRSQSPFWQPLYFFREGDPHELAVYQMLIEDRGIGTVSFAEFVQQLLSGPA
jgi:protein transport protein SEC24